MKIPNLVKNDTYLSEFAEKINERLSLFNKKEKQITQGKSLSDFANAHNFFGLHKQKKSWIYRDSLPGADEVFLIGQFSDWKEKEEYKLVKQKTGIFTLEIPENVLKDKDLYKLSVRFGNQTGERIPAYSCRVIQDENTKIFSAQVWDSEEKFIFKNPVPQKKDSILIYEVHVGMSSEEGKVSSFNEFRENILPTIKTAGYDTIQMMAIQEHPYYGSFGYHVSSFFAVSSRFGTPEDLKLLIDTAHGLGLRVIMDIVHSHAVRNEIEGISKYDGTDYQFFHTGARGLHPAWDSRCFDYDKNEVLHFLLSNCKYWLEEYNFDGFRFDGVTSMLYKNHGLSIDFLGYSDYFNENADQEACTYLMLANKLIHSTKPDAVTIAEEMSGMPGIASPIEDGGFGFDYRLSMGVPDFWIKIVKEIKDEDWHVGDIFYRLTDKRKDEKVISYVESHDQALVGDKTMIMRLADKDIYTAMSIQNMNLNVERAVALHKIIRLLTVSTAGNGYLNFMGNEFAHPEWIDFPRKDNNWSYHYARRQWHLRDDKALAYNYLNMFDREMIEIVNKYKVLESHTTGAIIQSTYDQVLIFIRSSLLFVFNVNPFKSFSDYEFEISKGKYRIILNSDSKSFLGHNRINENMIYETYSKEAKSFLKIYIPNRCCFVMERI